MNAEIPKMCPHEIPYEQCPSIACKTRLRAFAAPSSSAHHLNETKTLSKAEVMRALGRVGLGARLVNECLVELGYTLAPFPTAPNDQAQRPERKGTDE